MGLPGTQHSQNPAFVVGPGAIGLFLGWDLEAPRVEGFLGRSPLPDQVTLLSPGILGETRFAPTGTTLRNALRLLQHDPQPPTTFFICTPPECTHAVVDTLAEHCVAARRTHVTWVYCSNGVIAEETRARVRRVPHWSQARALVYAGCTRTQQGNSVRVVHAGGTRVSYGWLEGEAHPQISGRILTWELSNDIEKEEAEKLFVNLALAHAAGPRLVSNGETLSFLDALEPFAVAFSRAFSARRLVPTEILARTRETAERTRGNINSVSLAWSQGNRAPLEALLHALAQQPLGQAAIAGFWSGLPPEPHGG